MRYVILTMLLVFLALPALAGVKEDARALSGELNRNWFMRVATGGVDETLVYGILKGTNSDYRRRLRQEYTRLTGNSLTGDLNALGVNDGSDVIRAQLFLNQGGLTEVDALFLNMRGGGTDTKTLFNNLLNLSKHPGTQTSYQVEWERKYGSQGQFYQGESSIIGALEGDLSGLDEISALKLYRGESLSGEEIIRISELSGQRTADVRHQGIVGEAERRVQLLGKSVEEIRQEIERELQGGELFTESKLPEGRKLEEAECGPKGSGYRLCVPLPGQSRTVTDFGDYVRLLYQFALAIAGIVVFVRIVYGGIRYTLSAGNIVSQSEARSIITQAIYGLILLFAAALILYLINPNLLRISGVLRGGGERINFNAFPNSQISGNRAAATYINDFNFDFDSQPNRNLFKRQADTVVNLEEEIGELRQSLGEEGLSEEDKGAISGILKAREEKLSVLREAIKLRPETERKIQRFQARDLNIKEVYFERLKIQESISNSNIAPLDF